MAFQVQECFPGVLTTLGQTTPVTIRCAITVIATVPILIVYPFLPMLFRERNCACGYRGDDV